MTTNVPAPLQTGFRLFTGDQLNDLFALIQTLATDDSVTATPSGTQGNSYQMKTTVIRVTTVATGGDSITLAPAKPGKMRVIINGTATSMNVFPGVGDQINGAGANTAAAVAGNKTAILFCLTQGNWVGPVALA